ncbi:MAG: hypothetical protein JWQ04_2106 [Pedosphaera sp.]|nr:hypothetical protein [Pedosphaera sp.]
MKQSPEGNCFIIQLETVPLDGRITLQESLQKRTK